MIAQQQVVEEQATLRALDAEEDEAHRAVTARYAPPKAACQQRLAQRLAVLATLKVSCSADASVYLQPCDADGVACLVGADAAMAAGDRHTADRVVHHHGRQDVPVPTGRGL